MKDWQITKEGKLIVVSKLWDGGYVPVVLFRNMHSFNKWAISIVEQTKSLADLSEAIANTYQGFLADVPKGEIVDFVNSMEKLDGIK
jgi:hypothetical protein